MTNHLEGRWPGGRAGQDLGEVERLHCGVRIFCGVGF